MGSSAWVWPTLSCSNGGKDLEILLGNGLRPVVSQTGGERRSLTLTRGGWEHDLEVWWLAVPSLRASVTGGPASPEGTLGLPENAVVYPSSSRRARDGQ